MSCFVIYLASYHISSKSLPKGLSTKGRILLKSPSRHVGKKKKKKLIKGGWKHIYTLFLTENFWIMNNRLSAPPTSAAFERLTTKSQQNCLYIKVENMRATPATKKRSQSISSPADLLQDRSETPPPPLFW